MSGKERAIAAFLLAIAVGGGALIPRLLSSAPRPLGIALGPGPGRSVVQAPAIPKPPRHVAPTPPLVAPPAEPAPQPIARVSVKPAAKPAAQKHGSAPPPAPPTAGSPSSPPPPPAPPPPPPPPPTTSPPPQALSPASTRPGHGYGDKNHVHTGPPGHAARAAGRGSHLRGSGHGKGHAEVSSHTVGSHHRRVGHLAATPSRAAPAPHAAGPKARSDAGDQGGQESPPQTVGQSPSQGNGNGNGNGKGNGNGDGHGSGNGHGH
jgi:hypothetical protein